MQKFVATLRATLLPGANCKKKPNPASLFSCINFEVFWRKHLAIYFLKVKVQESVTLVALPSLIVTLKKGNWPGLAADGKSIGPISYLYFPRDRKTFTPRTAWNLFFRSSMSEINNCEWFVIISLCMQKHKKSVVCCRSCVLLNC